MQPLRRFKKKELGLLATRFTMEDDFLRNRYKSKFGIETIIPDKHEREEIHRIIYDELVRGVIKETSKQRFLEIIDVLIQRGAEGIISGCTEIELLLKPADITIELFETIRIHAEKAVNVALEN